MGGKMKTCFQGFSASEVRRLGTKEASQGWED